MENTNTIEIDCAPFSTRPDEHFKNMCTDLDMQLEGFKLVSKFFGNYTWEILPFYEEIYKSKQHLVKDWLTKLHNNGRCRYASW
jgi:hypothetical protein